MTMTMTILFAQIETLLSSVALGLRQFVSILSDKADANLQGIFIAKLPLQF